MNRVLLYKPPDKQQRPNKWMVSPASLHSPFVGMWYGLEHLFAFWDAKDDPLHSGYPRDIALGSRAINNNFNTGGNEFGSGPINYGLQFTGTAAAQATVGAATTPASRSVMCAFDMIAFPSSGHRFIWGMGPSGGAWLADVGVGSDGSILYYEVTGGAVTLQSAANLIALRRQHCIVCVSDNSAGMFIYLDGRQVASNGTTGFFTLFGMQCTSNAQPSPFTTNAAQFNLHIGGWWPRALKPVEALALSADPFGLIRPRPFYAIADDSQNANAAPGVSTWAVPAPTVTTQVSAAPAPAIATWSVPAPEGQSNIDGTPTSAVAAWSVLTPTTSLAATATPAPAVAAWSVPGALGVGEDTNIAFSGQVYPV